MRIACNAAHTGAHNIRPFVCKAKNPLDCEIFIIGKNPATQMTKNFWKQFCNQTKGFEYHRWKAAYLTAKRRTLKTRSATRERIDGIVEVVTRESRYNVLETNLSPIEAPSGSLVRVHSNRKDVLEALLRC